MTDNIHLPKDLAAAVARVRLNCFLNSSSRLDYTSRVLPRISIVILVYNRAEVTFSCLQSLAIGHNRTPFELIIVDNGSIDETSRLLERLDGVKIIRNVDNQGFPRGVNQGASIAQGEFLLLLNNDTEVLGQGLDRAVELFDCYSDIGVVGGPIVLLDGTLQEAGCGIWHDGWNFQYGRGDRLDDPAYGFVRDVDYCSAACLMIRSSLFRELGQFDESFSPGYFEDPEFSVRVWKSGHRIVYLPDLVVLHYENATSSGIFDIPDQCNRNHALFFARHHDWLKDQPKRETLPPLFVRCANDSTIKVLFIVYPGSIIDLERVVNSLVSLNASVSLAFMGNSVDFSQTSFKHLETFRFMDEESLATLFRSRRGFYGFVLCTNYLGRTLTDEIEYQSISFARWTGSSFVIC